MNLSEGASVSTGAIRWGMASRPFDPAAACGDQAHVVEHPPDLVLVAVADGLGHGDAAAAAAQLAVSVAEQHADEALPVIMQRCHAALTGTRGAAVSLASFDLHERTLSWLAVGNVSGVVTFAPRQSGRRGERLTLRGGTVGLQLPSLRTVTVPLTARDMLFIATDGLRAEWSDKLRPGEPLHIAERLLERYASTADDALVFAARYFGDAWVSM